MAKDFSYLDCTFRHFLVDDDGSPQWLNDPGKPTVIHFGNKRVRRIQTSQLARFSLHVWRLIFLHCFLLFLLHIVVKANHEKLGVIEIRIFFQ